MSFDTHADGWMDRLDDWKPVDEDDDTIHMYW